jgi:serine/threonine-protein kinase RsbW
MKATRGVSKISLHREVGSNLAEAETICRDIRSLLEDHGLVATVRFSVELAARECLNNAIIHGNRFDAGKRVALDLRIKRKWIYLQIIDEGAGFNWKRRRVAPPDGTALSGRGLSISAAYAHRITFNRRGNQVTLRLKKSAEED